MHALHFRDHRLHEYRQDVDVNRWEDVVAFGQTMSVAKACRPDLQKSFLACNIRDSRAVALAASGKQAVQGGNVEKCSIASESYDSASPSLS